MTLFTVDRKKNDDAITEGGESLPFRVIQESDFKKKHVSFLCRLNQKMKKSIHLILCMILFLQLFFAPAHVRKRRNKLWKKHMDTVSETFNQKQKELSEQFSFSTKDLYEELYAYLNLVDKDHHKKEIDGLLARHDNKVKPMQKDIDELVEKVLKQGDKISRQDKELHEAEKMMVEEQKAHEEHHYKSVVEEAAENALLELSRKEAEMRQNILARKQELADIESKIHTTNELSKEDVLANAVLPRKSKGRSWINFHGGKVKSKEVSSFPSNIVDPFCGDCEVTLKDNMKSTCNGRVALLRINFKRTAVEAKKAVMMEFPAECTNP